MFRHESGPSMSSVLDMLSLGFVGAGQMWEASGWGKTGAHRQVRTENVDWRLAAITEAGCSDLSRGQPHLRPRTCEVHLPRTPARRVARAPPRLLPRLPCVRAHSVPAGLLRRALPGPRRALRPFLPRGPSSPILAPSAVLSVVRWATRGSEDPPSLSYPRRAFPPGPLSHGRVHVGVRFLEKLN